MNTNIGLWAKQIIGALGAGLAALITALQDGHVSVAEGVTVGIVVLVAFGGISALKNASSGPLYYAKAIVAAVVSLAGAFVTAIGSTGWPPTGNQWLVIALALLNAFPVAITSNSRSSDADQFED